MINHILLSCDDIFFSLSQLHRRYKVEKSDSTNYVSSYQRLDLIKVSHT